VSGRQGLQLLRDGGEGLEREVGKRAAAAGLVAGWIERGKGAGGQGAAAAGAISAPVAGYKGIRGAADAVAEIVMARILSAGAREEREGEGETVAVRTVAENTLEHSLEYVHRLLVRRWLHEVKCDSNHIIWTRSSVRER
jgi:hypothetical protein